MPPKKKGEGTATSAGSGEGVGGGQRDTVEESTQISDLKSLFESKFEEMKTEFKLQIDGLRKEMSVRFDDLKLEIEEKLRSIRDEFTIKTEENETKIEKISELTSQLQSSLARLNIRDNEVEQRARDPSIRIYNLKIPENTACDQYVYDTILKPAFNIAVSAKKLDIVPSFLSTIEKSHPLPTRATSGDNQQTPAIILKFQSRRMKEIFHAYKKDVLSNLNQNTTTQVFITDDITKRNLSCMSRLKADQSVQKVIFLQGSVRFFMKNEPTKMLTVKNPLARDRVEMQIYVYPPV